MRSTNKFYKIIFNSMRALIGHKTILHVYVNTVFVPLSLVIL